MQQLDSILIEFKQELKDNVTVFTANILAIEHDFSNVYLVNELGRIAHNMKGASAILGFSKMSHLFHKVETIFDEVRNEKIELNKVITTTFFEFIDLIDELSEYLTSEGEYYSDEQMNKISFMEAKLENLATSGKSQKNTMSDTIAKVMEDVGFLEESVLERFVISLKIIISKLDYLSRNPDNTQVDNFRNILTELDTITTQSNLKELNNLTLRCRAYLQNNEQDTVNNIASLLALLNGVLSDIQAKYRVDTMEELDLFSMADEADTQAPGIEIHYTRTELERFKAEIAAIDADILAIIHKEYDELKTNIQVQSGANDIPGLTSSLKLLKGTAGMFELSLLTQKAGDISILVENNSAIAPDSLSELFVLIDFVIHPGTIDAYISAAAEPVAISEAPLALDDLFADSVEESIPELPEVIYDEPAEVQQEHTEIDALFEEAPVAEEQSPAKSPEIRIEPPSRAIRNFTVTSGPKSLSVYKAVDDALDVSKAAGPETREAPIEVSAKYLGTNIVKSGAFKTECKSIDPEMIPEFLEEFMGYRDNLREMMTAYLHNSTPENLKKMSKIGHTIKGSAGMMGLNIISKQGAAVENLAEEQHSINHNTREVTILTDMLTTMANILMPGRYGEETVVAEPQPSDMQDIIPAYQLLLQQENLSVPPNMGFRYNQDESLVAKEPAAIDAVKVDNDLDNIFEQLSIEEAPGSNLPEETNMVAFKKITENVRPKTGYSNPVTAESSEPAVPVQEEVEDVVTGVENMFAVSPDETPVYDLSRPEVSAPDQETPSVSYIPDESVAAAESPASDADAAFGIENIFASNSGDVFSGSEPAESLPPVSKKVPPSLHQQQAAPAGTDISQELGSIFSGDTVENQSIAQGSVSKIEKPEIAKELENIFGTVSVPRQEPPIPSVVSKPVPAPAAHPSGVHNIIEPAAMGDLAVPTGTQKVVAGPAIKVEDRYIRLDISKIDDLLNLIAGLYTIHTGLYNSIRQYMAMIGDISVSIGRLKNLQNALDEEYSLMLETAPAIQKHGDNAATSEFGELEMDKYTSMYRWTRELHESTEDLTVFSETLRNRLNTADNLLSSLLNTTNELQATTLKTRMGSLKPLSIKFTRYIRDLSQQQRKNINFSFVGDSLELDKSIINQLEDSLLHMIKNSLDHGIEVPADRTALGKPAQAQLRIEVYPQTDTVKIVILDDGRGISLPRIKEKAERMGISTARMTDQDLLNLIFMHGFSTAKEVSEISGRGIGMDVVKTTIEKLHGSIKVESYENKGSRFELTIPNNIFTLKAMIFYIFGDMYAMPYNNVVQSVGLNREKIVYQDGKYYYQMRDTNIEILDITKLFYERPFNPEMYSLTHGLVITIDKVNYLVPTSKILGLQNIQTKAFNPPLDRTLFYTGASVDASGNIFLILNIDEIKNRLEAMRLAQIASVSRLTNYFSAAKTEEVKEEVKPTILIVDDSLSIRNIVGKMVAKAGYTALTAKDGMEGLEVIKANGAKNITGIILDVEMPRMTGYEMLSELRSDEAISDIPVMMLTSRAGEKHKQKALELGADGYIAKPYHEEEFVNIIKKVTSTRHSPDNKTLVEI